MSIYESKSMNKQKPYTWQWNVYPIVYPFLSHINDIIAFVFVFVYLQFPQPME